MFRPASTIFGIGAARARHAGSHPAGAVGGARSRVPALGAPARAAEHGDAMGLAGAAQSEPRAAGAPARAVAHGDALGLAEAAQSGPRATAAPGLAGQPAKDAECETESACNKDMSGGFELFGDYGSDVDSVDECQAEMYTGTSSCLESNTKLSPSVVQDVRAPQVPAERVENAGAWSSYVRSPSLGERDVPAPEVPAGRVEIAATSSAYVPAPEVPAGCVEIAAASSAYVPAPEVPAGRVEIAAASSAYVPAPQVPAGRVEKAATSSADVPARRVPAKRVVKAAASSAYMRSPCLGERDVPAPQVPAERERGFTPPPPPPPYPPCRSTDRERDDCNDSADSFLASHNLAGLCTDCSSPLAAAQCTCIAWCVASSACERTRLGGYAVSCLCSTFCGCVHLSYLARKLTGM